MFNFRWLSNMRLCYTGNTPEGPQETNCYTLLYYYSLY